MARIRQSKPDSGLGFQVKVLHTLQGVPSSLGSGLSRHAAFTVPKRGANNNPARRSSHTANPPPGTLHKNPEIQPSNRPIIVLVMARVRQNGESSLINPVKVLAMARVRQDGESSLINS